jgi:hypothetical protein
VTILPAADWGGVAIPSGFRLSASCWVAASRIALLIGPVLSFILVFDGASGWGAMQGRHRPAPRDLRGARLLQVGPRHMLKLPSQASLVARAGDVVLIDPGTYADCAVWRADHLTIAASGPGVVLSGRTCREQAIFIIEGDDVTVRGITFAHAAVPGHNGAGILAEGGNLTVESSQFIDNEDGILSGVAPAATIRILDSTFRGNGSCVSACAHALYAGRAGLLDVEHSRFTDTHVAHDIKSRALRTVLLDNSISDGPRGNSSYLVDLPNGGDLLMAHNTFSKGPHTDNETTAVDIGEEGVSNPTHSLEIIDNRFTNLLPNATAFVTNHTDTPAVLIGNRLAGEVVPLVGPGTVQ